MKLCQAPVIFVTGFPEALLTGDRVEPAFVLSKPFDPEALTACISQVLAVGRPEPTTRKAATRRRKAKAAA